MSGEQSWFSCFWQWILFPELSLSLSLITIDTHVDRYQVIPLSIRIQAHRYLATYDYSFIPLLVIR